MPKSDKVVPVVTWFGFPRKRGTQRNAQREVGDDPDGHLEQAQEPGRRLPRRRGSTAGHLAQHRSPWPDATLDPMPVKRKRPSVPWPWTALTVVAKGV